MSNNKPSLLARLGRLLRRDDHFPSTPRISVPAKGSQKTEDDAVNFPYPPDREEIQVVEVDSVEFVQEWGRTVAIRVEAEKHSSTTQHEFVDRRLPNFDRRNPNHNRRSGDGYDRRHSIQPRPAIKPIGDT